MKNKRMMNSKRGFTFLEILMCVVLLAFAIIPMASLMMRESQATAMGRTRTFALHLASNIIERVKMEELEAIKVSFGTPAAAEAAISSIEELNRPSDSDIYNSLMNDFIRTATLEIDPASNGRKAVLKVQIKWDEKGHPRQIERAIIIVDSHFPAGKAD